MRPENPKTNCSIGLSQSLAPQALAPGGRPAAAVCSWNADIDVALHPTASRSLPVSPLAADRDPRTPAPARRLPADSSPASNSTRRSGPLVLALPPLVAVARSAGLRPARDGHRLATRKFREHWTKLSDGSQDAHRSPRGPRSDPAMSTANPLWGALGSSASCKIGIEVAKSTVEKYMVRHRKPPSPPGAPSSRTTPGDRRDRLLRRADRPEPGPLRLPPARP